MEVVLKEVEGGGHVGNASVYLYAGARPADLHPGAWFLWTALGHITAYAAALLLFRLLKARCSNMDLLRMNFRDTLQEE